MIKDNLQYRCNTFLYTQMPGGYNAIADEYITHALGYPDFGSDFDKFIKWRKHLFRIPYIGIKLTPVALQYLKRDGYDVMLLGLEDRIIGHSAFQEHKDNSLHIFSVWVSPLFRNNGLGTRLVEDTWSYAKHQDIERMRIGGGKNYITNRIHTNFSKRSAELGLITHEGNWVKRTCQITENMPS